MNIKKILLFYGLCAIGSVTHGCEIDYNPMGHYITARVPQGKTTITAIKHLDTGNVDYYTDSTDHGVICGYFPDTPCADDSKKLMTSIQEEFAQYEKGLNTQQLKEYSILSGTGASCDENLRINTEKPIDPDIITKNLQNATVQHSALVEKATLELFLLLAHEYNLQNIDHWREQNKQKWPTFDEQYNVTEQDVLACMKAAAGKEDKLRSKTCLAFGEMCHNLKFSPSYENMELVVKNLKCILSGSQPS